MGSGRAPRDAHEQPTGVRIPKGRTQAGERRHEHHATGVRHAAGERLDVTRPADDAEAVAQPPDERARYEHRALEHVIRPGTARTAERRQEPGRAFHMPRARGAEQKRACSVGALRISRCEAALGKAAGLLIARTPRDRQLGPEDLGCRRAERPRRRPHLRKDRWRDVEDAAELRAPGLPIDVEQQCATGVRGIGGVHAAAREPPDQKRVDGAEQNFSRHTSLPQAGHRLQEVHDLRRREIRVEHEPRAPANVCLEPAGLEPCAHGRRHSALPDDGGRDRPARRPFPEDRRLALVGDSDRGHGSGRRARLGEHPPRAVELRAPDVFRIVLDDAEIHAPLPEPRMLRKLLLGRGERPPVPIEEHGPARRGALIEREHAGGFRGVSCHRRCVSFRPLSCRIARAAPQRSGAPPPPPGRRAASRAARAPPPARSTWPATAEGRMRA